jgi:hypothetical protein
MRNLFKHFMKKIFGLFLFAFILVSCQYDEEMEGSCKFHVISYGDGVVGWYIVDNDDPVTFSVSEMKDSSYSLSVNFATPESSIYIFAKAASDSTESISVMLYDNGKLLQSKSAYKVVDEILINELSYTDFVSDTK